MARYPQTTLKRGVKRLSTHSTPLLERVNRAYWRNTGMRLDPWDVKLVYEYLEARDYFIDKEEEENG